MRTYEPNVTHRIVVNWRIFTIRAKKTRINSQIRVPEVRLIDQNGDQVGVVPILDAIRRAEELGFDLVEISPTAKPPVCRIMDYGKFVFDQNKKLAIAKKKQKQVEIKEIKFRPGTDVGDYNVKVRKIVAFLERGDKVKVSLRFRGREMQHRELGMDLLQRVKADLPDPLIVEQEPRLEGRQMTMVVSLGKAGLKLGSHAEIEDDSAEDDDDDED